MKWTELTINTCEEGIEPVTGVLMELGVNSFVIEDPKDALEFIRDNSDTWDMIDSSVTDSLEKACASIKVYISDTPDGEKLQGDICSAVSKMKAADSENSYGSLNIDTTRMDDEDWANNWKAYFKPFTVGEKLAVCPTWETYDNPENRIVLNIDPASSFGSGLHESTRLCLTALEKYIKRGDTLIDVGCGSGILSVAAAKLGCKSVTAVDIDPNAVLTAEKCAEVNGAQSQIKVVKGDLISAVGEKADIVVANIFASVIVRLAADIKKALKTGGVFITSGIVADSLEDVLNAYDGNNLSVLEIMHDGEWYAVIGRL